MPVAEEQTQKKILAFGGTGKTVALIALKLGRLLGEPPSVVVVDFPAGSDHNREDNQLDEDLRSEGLADHLRLSTLPDDMPKLPRVLTDAFNLPQEVADALFSDNQQRTPPVEGLNQEPQVGATVAQWKLAHDGNAVKDKCLTGQPEVFFVAGLGGGTGTGVTPPFAKFLKNSGIRSHGVFLMPWRDIGNQGRVNNTNQNRNAASLLQYLRTNGLSMFNDWVVLGSADRFATEEGGPARPVHPTLILGALYVHLWHTWTGGYQLGAKMLRLETPESGIDPREIKGRNGNLYDMLVLSYRLEHILREIAQQMPDERLSIFNLFPLSYSMSWNSIEWLVKLYREKTNQVSYAQAWIDIRTELLRVADQEQKRRNWIVNLVSDRRLFQFDAQELDRDARLGLTQLTRQVQSADEHAEFRFGPQEDARGALQRVVHFVWQMIYRRLNPLVRG
jgi:hypothetical protein